MKNDILYDSSRPPRSPRDWALVLILVYSLLSHPFFVEPFFLRGYKVLFLALFLASLAVLLQFPRTHFPQKRMLANPWLVTLVASYGGYVFFLLVASILHAEASTLAILSLFFVRVVVALMLFTFLSAEVYRWTLDRYIDLVFFCSVTGIVMVLLVFTGALSPLGVIEIPGVDRTLREVYALGLVWGSIYIPGGGLIVRLQSFADEPGTFAFMLLLAILWALHRHKAIYVGVMTVALLLTWSVGAMVAGVALLAVSLFRKDSYKLLFVTMIGVVALSVFYQSNADFVEVVQRYLDSKAGDNVQGNTSYGEREEYMVKVSELILAHPEGFGAGAKEIGQPPVGWWVALVDSGVLGYAFYLISGMALMWMAFRSALLGKGEVSILAIMVLVLAFSALQRARIDYSIWHFWVLTAFLKFYISSPQHLKY